MVVQLAGLAMERHASQFSRVVGEVQWLQQLMLEVQAAHLIRHVVNAHAACQ